MTVLRAALRLAAILFATLALLPIHLIGRLCGRRAQRSVERFWFRILAAVAGLHVTVDGEAPASAPALYAANHVSYLDIVVLGSCLDAFFIAKADVRDWPGLGFLARISGTQFIRRAGTQARGQAAQLGAVLSKGRSLILFPEGTSSDGSAVLPFKSTLFAMVEGRDCAVQPIAIRYHALDGEPIRAGAARDAVAWYGEMMLLPHLWALLGRKNVKAQVTVGTALDATLDRKTLAARCESVVRSRVEAAACGGGATAPSRKLPVFPHEEVV